MVNDILTRDLKRLTAIDSGDGLFIGRVWVPDESGPSPVVVLENQVYDFSRLTPTTSELLNVENLVQYIVNAISTPWVRKIGYVQDFVENSHSDLRNIDYPFFLAPTDLQAVRACGVTFVASMVERVIEEFSNGELDKAAEIRKMISLEVGDNLSSIVPGSEVAKKLKESLISRNLWSQYLEVGIGPDAEVFNKAQPMAAVGVGAEIGIRSDSSWNNPEPEVVLAINRVGTVVGATIGNDVNLRDFEGRSALLLGKAKDNNASCAIGPFIRLFDEKYSMEDIRKTKLTIDVHGVDGFSLRGHSNFSEISRDPLDLVNQAINRNHQYPDGLVLFLGTQFAPVVDRDDPGQGFTHKLGDIVSISCPRLGVLVNRINHCDHVAPWSYGVTDLIKNLSERKLI